MFLHKNTIPSIIIVSLEYHLYEDGLHGLSLAKPHTDGVNCDMIKPEVQSWIDLAEVWLNNL